MPDIRRGSGPAYHQIARGSVMLREIRRGSVLRWSASPVRDGFDGRDGFLSSSWTNELAPLDLGELISDGFGFLIDGLGNVVGSTVALIEGGVNGLGELVSATGNTLVDAYCGAWGGSAPPDGLIGLVNGIPIFGELIGGLLGEWLEGDLDIQSLIGKIPVFGQLAEMIGLIPDQLGGLADPINFVVDAIGDVIGTITCGAFQLTGGSEEDIHFVIGQTGGSARMLIPDGLMNLNTKTSRFRHNTVVPADNGWLELQVAEIGTPGFTTRAYRRHSNTGGMNGVGMDLTDSAVGIVRKVGGVEQIVKPNITTFDASTRLRLVQAGDLHTLVRDGIPVGEWNDAGSTAAEGAANRSVAMSMQGAKERAGTRKFSPTLNYIEAA
jgi:hypothetical protein